MVRHHRTNLLWLPAHVFPFKGLTASPSPIVHPGAGLPLRFVVTGGNDEVGGHGWKNRDAGYISLCLCKTRKGGPAAVTS